MRRCLMVVGLLAVGGCSNFRSLFSAHAGVVADVGGQKLTVERLSEILTAGRRGPEPSRESADYVTQLWVDHALFAQAAAADKLPVDSASVAEAAWSQIAETRSRRWHDTIVARRPAADPSKADSVYAANGVRVLQHILFRSMPTSAPAERNTARKQTENTLAQIRGGADFGALAAKLSQDPGSAADSGYLPPSPRGQFVPAFDSAAWALAPGGTTGIIETQFGYHLIKRPSADVVRGRLLKYLGQAGGQRLDSLYMDSLATANKIEVSTNAPALIKATLEDPNGSRRSSKVLATYTGGKLTVGEFVRWMQALPPHYTSQLKQVPDSMLQRFAKILTQNTLLIRAADAAGIRLTADEWAGMMTRHRGMVDTLKIEMGLTGAEFQDSTLRPAERKKTAMAKMEKYFDELVAGTRRMRPIPTTFAALLRERGSYRVHTSGVNRAVAMAKAAYAKDSATAGLGAPPAPFRPAPGPAPIPGGHAPATPDSAHRQEAK